MAIVQDPFQAGLNSWFYVLWLTTIDGEKYHLTINSGINGAGDQGLAVAGFLGLEDLSNFTHSGGIIKESGTASTASLSLQAPSQNLSSPLGSDNYTDMYYSGDYGGISTKLHMQPTGPNLYLGGSGYVTLSPASPSDYLVAPPGYSWYWGNPNLRVEGTITLNGRDVEIDSSNSFGFLERQWGNMQLRNWYLYWIYLSNGVFLHVWINEPTLDGFNVDDISIATVWYPNGVHEVLPVDNTTTAWDTSRSPKTGKLYFNEFQLNLSSRNSSIRVTKPIRDTVLIPLADYGSLLNVSEAYIQGEGFWEGQPVEVFGHLEQISTLV
ncbi:putative mucin-1 (muc-1) protein [Neofusicoccum parvum]|uniref:Mucin-1 (Muc-1) protein n=1 Tax=Neofusicoccum parvum TaxID=310453 RepID=A0ACB5SEV7_9PEZI|nr:putative mucin-1 (muc-1) protein [Neofusicoccum parvum]